MGLFGLAKIVHTKYCRHGGGDGECGSFCMDATGHHIMALESELLKYRALQEACRTAGTLEAMTAMSEAFIAARELADHILWPEPVLDSGKDWHQQRLDKLKEDYRKKQVWHPK